jgi:hypothetical protein
MHLPALLNFMRPVLCVIRQPPRLHPWGGFSREALSSLLPYLSVALPGAAMICLDWWAFEALTLLAGLLPGELGLGCRMSLPCCTLPGGWGEHGR